MDDNNIHDDWNASSTDDQEIDDTQTLGNFHPEDTETLGNFQPTDAADAQTTEERGAAATDDTQTIGDFQETATEDTKTVENDGNAAAGRQESAAQGHSDNYNTYREGRWNTATDSQKQTIGDEAKTRLLVREELKRNYKPRRNWLGSLLLLIVGSLVGTMGGWAISSHINSQQAPVSSTAQTSTQTSAHDAQPISINVDDETNVESAVAAKTIPSIVGITTQIETQSQNPFFNMGTSVGEAVGSGVIVSSNGYIVTNSHVVNDGNFKTMKVALSDGTEYDGKLLWNDSTLDLAIVKVDAKDLPAIEIGDSSTVAVGNKAIAIGNPLGLDLQSTLTSGYISGLNRTIQLNDGQIMDGLLQTDAAINSGNSGGALLNAKGQLIGINTAKPELADGIGFSIPINTAKPIIDKVIETGSYEPLYIGISGINVQVYQQYTNQQLPVNTGVLVMDVYADSPAGDADIQKGDVITKIDGKPVDSMNSLKTILLDYSVGSKATITYNRDGDEVEKEITFRDYTFPKENSQETPNQTPDTQNGENGGYHFELPRP